MLITTTEQKNIQSEILSYIPIRLRPYLAPCLSDKTEEVRLRTNRPLSVYQNSEVYFITSSCRLSKKPYDSVLVTKDDLDAATGLLCNRSVYAFEDEIKNGYITISGGHRVGLCGNAVIHNDMVSFINNISGLNYRIAHEIKGCSDSVIRDIYFGGKVKNTLIISPPGCGKTTLLRDISRAISNTGKRISILDERGEIASMHNGVPGFEIGPLTDVLSNCPKQTGIPMLLRSMAPDVIITDELSGDCDILAIDEAKSRGVNIIATIHGHDIPDIPDKILNSFSCLVVLSSRFGVGTVEKVMLR